MGFVEPAADVRLLMPVVSVAAVAEELVEAVLLVELVPVQGRRHREIEASLILRRRSDELEMK